MKLQYQFAYTMQGIKWFGCAVIAFGFLIFLVYKLVNKERIRYGMKTVGVAMYIIAAGLFLSGILLGYYGAYDASMLIYMGALVVGQFAIIILFFYLSKLETRILVQMLICSMWLLVWYVAACKSEVTIKEYPSIVLAGLIVVTSNAILWLKVLFKSRLQVMGVIRCNCINKKNVGIIILIILTFLMSAFFIWKLPFLWDAADYAVELISASRWEFTLGTVCKLNLCGHRSAGYAFLTLPGVWLFNDPFIGIHIIQTFIVVLTVIMFWEILRIKFKNIDTIERTVVSALFISCPAFFGLSSGYNMDFGLLCLTVWVIYAWVCDMRIFKIVFGMLMCMTKEPAVILFAGMGFGFYVYSFVKSKSKKCRLFTCLPYFDWVALSFPLVWWFVIGKLISINNSQHASWSEEGFKWLGYLSQIDTVPNNFGLSWNYIAIQLIHEFMFNFEWIIVIGIISGTVVLATRKKDARNCIDGKLMLVLGCGIVFFTVFNCIYITHPHYRYVAPVFSLLLVIFVELITKTVTKRFARLIIYATVTMLLIIQTFRCIDPAILLNGNKVGTGRSFVINYDELMEENKSYKISDYTLYNLQGNQYGGVCNEAFSELNMENTLIVIASDGGDLPYCAMGGRTVEDGHGIGYNSRTGMFSQVKSEGYCNLELGILDEKTGLIEINSDNVDLNRFDNIYYINPTFSTIGDVEGMLTAVNYKVLSKSLYSYYGGWDLEIYTISPY